MSLETDGAVLVTGARGHIGGAVCRTLREAEANVIAVDLDNSGTQDTLVCDLRVKDQVSQLFRSYPIRSVIHLAAVLPSSFLVDPIQGAEVNLSGSVQLMIQAAQSQVKRFVFASSTSVYGSSEAAHPLTEDDPPSPTDPYGASKLAVELVGNAFADRYSLEFVALRIARVVGAGVHSGSSPWRGQIFQASSGAILIPFAPEAKLLLVHVDEVARMLVTLTTADKVRRRLYNSPAEVWQARQLQQLVEENRRVRADVLPDGPGGGPICSGERFARDFGFQLRGLGTTFRSSAPARSRLPRSGQKNGRR
jgi:nucleoside-diphosphate-sugar epimerase